MNQIKLPTFITLAFILSSSIISPIANAFIVTSAPGDLFIDFVSSEAAPAFYEFGIGTPSTSSDVSERDVALIRDGTVLTSPSSVNMGFYSASSSIDFYFKSIFGGTFWGFSSNLTGSPTSFDLETFTDTNNSLGFGGSIIVQQGIDDWIFHMDDPASVDDDDNDFVVRVHVEPTSAIPVPPAIWLFGSGLIGLIGLARRKT